MPRDSGILISTLVILLSSSHLAGNIGLPRFFTLPSYESMWAFESSTAFSLISWTSCFDCSFLLSGPKSAGNLPRIFHHYHYPHCPVCFLLDTIPYKSKPPTSSHMAIIWNKAICCVAGPKPCPLTLAGEIPSVKFKINTLVPQHRLPFTMQVRFLNSDAVGIFSFLFWMVS